MFGKASIRVGELLPILMILLMMLLYDISELPSIRWGCMHEEEAAILNTSVPIQ